VEKQPAPTQAELYGLWRGPKPRRGSICYPNDDYNQVPTTFIAYGFAYCEHVTGLLIGGSYLQTLIGGETLQDPTDSASDGEARPSWVVRFSHVPPGDYVLVIVGTPGAEVARFMGLKVGSLIPKDTSIGSPPDNATVCTTFSASGTADNSGTATGVLKNAAGVVVANGVQVSPGPNWVVKFTSVPPGTYTLVITVGGVESAGRTVTASAGACL
jgi:hypothetical protein